MSNIASASLVMALFVLAASPAFSGNLVYRPINPSFGGDPFYSAHLLGTAEANNRHSDPNALNVDDIIDQIETVAPGNSEVSAPTGQTEAELMSVPSEGGLLLPN